jgi:hypothetical protein
MLNVYVHLVVRGLARAPLDDHGLLHALSAELPDAAFGSNGDSLTVTLSQFAVSTEAAARRQGRRTQAAVAAVGYANARVALEEAVREGLRDDFSVLIHFGRWHVCRLLECAAATARRKRG